MKPIAFLAIPVLALTASQSIAQVTGLAPLNSVVVGEYTLTTANESVAGLAAQQFSLGSGAYVDGIQLALIGSLTGNGGANCSFTFAITDQLNPGGTLGSLWVQGAGSVSLTSTLAAVSFSDGFPTVYLPARTYYVVVNTLAGPSPCSDPSGSPELFWLLNSPTAPKVGVVGPALVPAWTQLQNLSFSFNLLGPILTAPPTGGGLGQIARLVVEGPVTPPPGGPVEVQAGFVNLATGEPKLTPMTLVPGQVQTLDLDLGQFVSRPGERVELLPVLAQVPGTVSPPVQVTTSVQVLDAETGVGTVLAPAPLPGMLSPGLGPQILAHGETMRIDVVALSQDACVGQVSFNDRNGNALIPPTPINLSPGAGTFIDLKAHALGLEQGQQIEVQPVLLPGSPTGGAVALNSVCQASAQVFDTASGRTRTQQSTQVALPAAQ